MKVEIGSLVFVKLVTKKATGTFYPVWIRITGVSQRDGSMRGVIEREPWLVSPFEKDREFYLHYTDITAVFDENDGLDWCYSDNVTRCDCSGLCRNK